MQRLGLEEDLTMEHAAVPLPRAENLGEQIRNVVRALGVATSNTNPQMELLANTLGAMVLAD